MFCFVVSGGGGGASGGDEGAIFGVVVVFAMHACICLVLCVSVLILSFAANISTSISATPPRYAALNIPHSRALRYISSVLYMLYIYE